MYHSMNGNGMMPIIIPNSHFYLGSAYLQGTVSLQNLGNSRFKNWHLDIDGNTGAFMLSESLVSGAYWKLTRPDTQGENIADKVVIACISGRGGVAGAGRGMVQLRDTLRNELQSLGIKPDNIFRRSWNHNQDDNPFGAPWVEDLLREIDRRSKNPSYLAIIGHSYGGWAACRLSRVTSRVPDFVGLIDPVFGSTSTFTNGDIPRGKFIKNWYQNNSVFGTEPCTGIGVPCSPASNGISCGYQNVPGAHENVNEHFLKDWEGNRKRVSCGVGPRRHLLTSHLNIDEDQWIHRQIRDQIYNDLSKLIRVRQADGLTAP